MLSVGTGVGSAPEHDLRWTQEVGEVGPVPRPHCFRLCEQFGETLAQKTEILQRSPADGSFQLSSMSSCASLEAVRFSEPGSRGRPWLHPVLSPCSVTLRLCLVMSNNCPVELLRSINEIVHKTCSAQCRRDLSVLPPLLGFSLLRYSLPLAFPRSPSLTISPQPETTPWALSS